MKKIIDTIQQEIAEAEREKSLRGGGTAERGAILELKVSRLRALLKAAEW